MPPTLALNTARLRLRPFASDDLDNLYSLYGDPDVMRYVGKGARTRQETESALTSTLEHWDKHDFGIWAVEDRSSGRFLGRCGLRYFQDTPEIELSYTLGKETWGKGIATEAAAASLQFGFEQRKLDRIIAISMPDNVGSRRVMEKLGMRYEKNAMFFGMEHVMYAISRAEYATESGRGTMHAR